MAEFQENAPGARIAFGFDYPLPQAKYRRDGRCNTVKTRFKLGMFPADQDRARAFGAQPGQVANPGTKPEDRGHGRFCLPGLRGLQMSHQDLPRAPGRHHQGRRPVLRAASK